MNQSTGPSHASPLWWVEPNVLAGMRRPSIDPRRVAAAGQAPLAAFPDELQALYHSGIRAIVSLLPRPESAAMYQAAGFAFHHMPIEDGEAPTEEQFVKFVGFVTRQQAMKHPVVVHCEAGVGRTGTAIAGYLIAAKGATPDETIYKLRGLQPGAVETTKQMQFLTALYSARK